MSANRLQPDHRVVRLEPYVCDPRSDGLFDPAAVPLCVVADADALRSHLTSGTHRDNMLDRAAKGRHENRWAALHYRGLPRQERARELRDVVREHGWDPELIRRARTVTAGPTSAVVIRAET